MNTYKRIVFPSHTQYSFWGNVDYPTNRAARAERDSYARTLSRMGQDVRKWSLANQERKYSGLGQPDGTVGTVYYLDVLHTPKGGAQ